MEQIRIARTDGEPAEAAPMDKPARQAAHDSPTARRRRRASDIVLFCVLAGIQLVWLGVLAYSVVWALS